MTDDRKLGPQSSESARRWPSFEGKLHIERFRTTLNGLEVFHMGNPGLENRNFKLLLIKRPSGIICPHDDI